MLNVASLDRTADEGTVTPWELRRRVISSFSEPYVDSGIWRSPYVLAFNAVPHVPGQPLVYGWWLGSRSKNVSGLPFGDGVIVGSGVETIISADNVTHDERMRAILQAKTRRRDLAGRIEAYAPSDDPAATRVAVFDPIDRLRYPASIIGWRLGGADLNERFRESLRELEAYVVLLPMVERALERADPSIAHAYRDAL